MHMPRVKVQSITLHKKPHMVSGQEIGHHDCVRKSCERLQKTVTANRAFVTKRNALDADCVFERVRCGGSGLRVFGPLHPNVSIPGFF
jgi:hypothetical protein